GKHSVRGEGLARRREPMFRAGLESTDAALPPGGAAEEKTQPPAPKVGIAGKKPDPPLLRGLTDLDGKAPVAHILRRGDCNKPGAVVDPGVPEVLAPPAYRLTVREGFKTTGRRLALAKWLTDPSHPLTARGRGHRRWA